MLLLWRMLNWKQLRLLMRLRRWHFMPELILFRQTFLENELKVLNLFAEWPNLSLLLLFFLPSALVFFVSHLVYLVILIAKLMWFEFELKRNGVFWYSTSCSIFLMPCLFILIQGLYYLRDCPNGHELLNTCTLSRIVLNLRFDDVKRRKSDCAILITHSLTYFIIVFFLAQVF